VIGLQSTETVGDLAELDGGQLGIVLNAGGEMAEHGRGLVRLLGETGRLEALDQRAQHGALIAGAGLAGVIDRVGGGEDCRGYAIEVVRALDEIAVAGTEGGSTVDRQGPQLVDDLAEGRRVEFGDVVDANAKELLGHSDGDRPPSLIGDGGEGLYRFYLRRGVEDHNRGEVAGGRNMDDGEGVARTGRGRVRSRLGEVDGGRHRQENGAGLAGGWADVCGWEGRLGGAGLRSIVDLGPCGVQVFEVSDGRNHLCQLRHGSPTSSVRSHGDGPN